MISRILSVSNVVDGPDLESPFHSCGRIPPTRHSNAGFSPWRTDSPSFIQPCRWDRGRKMAPIHRLYDVTARALTRGKDLVQGPMRLRGFVLALVRPQATIHLAHGAPPLDVCLADDAHAPDGRLREDQVGRMPEMVETVFVDRDVHTNWKGALKAVSPVPINLIDGELSGEEPDAVDVPREATADRIFLSCVPVWREAGAYLGAKLVVFGAAMEQLNQSHPEA